MMEAPTFGAGAHTHTYFVYLYGLFGLYVDTILISPHHSNTYLLKNAKSRLIER